MTALFDFTVVAIGFDDADVLVDGAVGRGDFDGADVHRDSITTGKPSVKLKYRLWTTLCDKNVTTFAAGGAPPVCSKPRKNRGILKSLPARWQDICQT